MSEIVPTLSAILNPPASIEIDESSATVLRQPGPFGVLVTDAGPPRTLVFVLAAIRMCRRMSASEVRVALESLPFTVIAPVSARDAEEAYRRIVAGGGKARIVAVGRPFLPPDQPPSRNPPRFIPRSHAAPSDGAVVAP